MGALVAASQLAAASAGAVSVTLDCPAGSHAICAADATPVPSPPCGGTAVRVFPGVQAHQLRKTVPPNIDATGAVWQGQKWDDSRYPIVLSGDGCFIGGAVYGTYDRKLSWRAVHDLNHAALALKGPVSVRNFRADNVEDGVRPQQGADGFAVVGGQFSYIRDDLLENDWSSGGLFADNLNDGSYVQFSCDNSNPVDNHTALLTISDNLLHCQPMPGPDVGTSPGNGSCLFKWQKGYCPRVVFEDNVVFAEKQTPASGGIGISDDVVLERCGNNTLIYTGKEPINEKRLRKDPTTGAPCFSVRSANRADWDEAVTSWHVRHPEVAQ